MEADGVIEVFTGKSVEQMLAHGGSQSWVVNPQSIRGVPYCVCTRNDARIGEVGFPETSEPRYSAFLVGKIAGLRKVEHRNGRDRYLILFSEYAVIDPPIPNFRHGSTRNPVLYSNLEHCRNRGLDIEKLEFQPMPKEAALPQNPAPLSQSPDILTLGLSIAEAKEALAVFHRVPIENVQITIVG
jgi:hypothetical protein